MGYCYDAHNRLCCDVCGTAGGVRKIPCKFGYCPATALCAACRSSAATRAAIRDHCEANCRQASEDYARRQDERRTALEAGAYVRDWATGSFVGGFDVCKVGFHNAAGDEIVLTVPTAAYRLHGLLDVLTPEDFGYALSTARVSS